MISAVLEMPSYFIFSGSKESVVTNFLSSGQVALYTTAAGVSGAYPQPISYRLTSSASPDDKNSTMVA